LAALLGALASAAVALRRGPAALAGRVAMLAGFVAIFVQGLQSGLLARRLKMEQSQHAPTDSLASAVRTAMDIKLELGSGWWLSFVGAVVATVTAIVAWRMRGERAAVTS
jgi:hypothetical protein